jgi:hypothetical protein
VRGLRAVMALLALLIVSFFALTWGLRAYGEHRLAEARQRFEREVAPLYPAHTPPPALGSRRQRADLFPRRRRQARGQHTGLVAAARGAVTVANPRVEAQARRVWQQDPAAMPPFTWHLPAPGIPLPAAR